MIFKIFSVKVYPVNNPSDIKTVYMSNNQASITGLQSDTEYVLDWYADSQKIDGISGKILQTSKLKCNGFWVIF